VRKGIGGHREEIEVLIGWKLRKSGSVAPGEATCNLSGKGVSVFRGLDVPGMGARELATLGRPVAGPRATPVGCSSSLHESASGCEVLAIGGMGGLGYSEEEFKLFDRPSGGRSKWWKASPGRHHGEFSSETSHTSWSIV